MASNTNIQVANLDFGDIKQNFITYLQSQDTFKDYNFSGSAMSTLLDVLAYNTQYNAFYLNMVANEMFLDSALQRASVISHAKLMNYVPQSYVGAVAQINLAFGGVTTTTFTVPRYANFMSEAIDGVNYNYVTTDSYTTSVSNGQAQFNQIELKQGKVATYTFTVDSTTNPKYIFEIPDANIDTSTLVVRVQQSLNNNAQQTFNPTTDYLTLGSTDEVYFLQEAINGNYQLYFGDGILGQKLTDGNIISITYISTNGAAGGLANNFALMDNLGSVSSVTVTPYQAATQGRYKESIDSIKFQAPKAFASQGRAVSKNDYITILKRNNLGISFDAVSVWGGEENTPPAYGQVFISLKPAGAYDLTETQKKLLLDQVIRPISVVTVEPVLVNPDYTYIQLAITLMYSPAKTKLTAGEIQTGIQSTLYSYSATSLNTFNSTFSSFAILSAINSFDKSIVSSDFTVNLQKKIYPTLGTTTTYILNYNTPLKRGIYGSSISSSPGIRVPDLTNTTDTFSDVFFEEVPTPTGGLEIVYIVNPGFNYTSIPKITITGDGTGATASATIVNGRLYSINVLSTGSGYTTAIATVTAAVGDQTGTNAVLVCTLQGRYGVLKTYYNDSTYGKVVVNSNAGTIDYVLGVITIPEMNVLQVDNPLGQLTITASPTTTIIASTYNKIITIDPYDPNAIVVNVNQSRS